LHLVIQPRPSGTKSWALRFRRPNGRSGKLTLGRVDLSGKETSDDPVMGGALTLGQARVLANQIDRKQGYLRVPLRPVNSDVDRDRARRIELEPHDQ
jgi:hypothetical protein